MQLHLERLTSDDDTTIGAMFADGAFFGFTCEDEFRIDKVPGETRIPAGSYRIELRREGGMIQKYRAKYGDWHEGMLWLQDVPGFEFVYIHSGNTDDHTEGCVLIGWGATAVRGNMSIQHSRDAYEALARRVHEAVAAGDEVAIDIVDRDRAAAGAPIA